MAAAAASAADVELGSGGGGGNKAAHQHEHGEEKQLETVAAAAAAASSGDGSGSGSPTLAASVHDAASKDADAGSADAQQQQPPPPPAAATPRTQRNACLRLLSGAAALAATHWFILGLGCAIAFAAAVPKLGATGGYVRAEYSVKVPAIVLIFVISGLGLKTRVLLSAAGAVHLHALVQGVSLAAIPAIGYGVARSLRSRGGLSPALCDGLVVMACMPTTVSTNVVYTARAHGAEAVSLVNAVLGNIIGIFVTPAWLSHFLDVPGAAPYTGVLVEMAYTIIAPLVVGQALQYLAPKQTAWVKARVNLANVSSVCILLLVWLTFCNTFSGEAAGIKSLPGRDVVALVFLCVALFFLFLALSFAVARPPWPALRALMRVGKPEAVAVLMCGSTKTVALGVPLINVMYARVPTAGILALPLIIYHALQVLIGGLLVGPLRAWVGLPEGEARSRLPMSRSMRFVSAL